MFSEAVLQAKDDVMGYLEELQLLPPKGNAQSWNYQNQLMEMQKDVCSAGKLENDWGEGARVI